MDSLPYLLLISLALEHGENSMTTPATTNTTSSTTSTPGVNLTTTMPSSPKSTVPTTVISDLTENTTSFNGTTHNSETLSRTTAVIAQSTSPLQTSQSTSPLQTSQSTSPLQTSQSTSPLQTSQSTSPLQTSQSTSPRTDSTSLTSQTTAGYTSTAANSSHTDNTTAASTDTTTHGLRLNFSEETMTIVFSAVLGLFALAMVGFVFHRCKHKIQYLHRPLSVTSDTGDAFVADDDTLVISGGLYDEHPIYDNVPTIPADQSQFRLQFLH